MSGAPLIVSFASHSYRPLCENWLRSLSAAGHRPFRIYALDGRTERWLDRKSIPTERVFLPSRLRVTRSTWLGELWVRRLEILGRLLKQGHDVLHSDLDAVWRRDPLPLLRDSHWDVMASRGTTFPREFYEKFGFVLCMGFIYFRARPSVMNWVDALATQLRQVPQPDDQRELNRSLLDARPVSGGLEQGPLRIQLLDPRQFSRGPEGTHVAHPLAPKRVLPKVRLLRDLGLWDSPVPVP